MHQTKKGNQWHFGMKLHIEVDSETGVMHSMTTTAANVHDVSEAHRLLHGGESQVRGDAGYRGAGKREENRGREVNWQVAMRPGQRRKPDPGSGEALAERNKASIRAKSLPSTAIGGGAPLPESEAGVRVRQEPALAKAGVRYRGLAKNTQRLTLLLGLGNLLTGEQWDRILPRTAVGADHGPNGNRIRGRTLQKTSRRPDIPAKLTR
jgi:IS5 family transposase